MTTYTKKKLNAILIAHSKWLANDPDGVKANLKGANLWSANLSEISGKQIQTFVYNRHTAYAIDDFITIGCECHPIAHWVEHYGAIGQEAGYTAEEIEAYGRWIMYIGS